MEKCKNNFKQLSNKIFPKKIKEFKKTSKYKVNKLFVNGAGVKTIIKKLKLKKDIAGLYAFIDKGEYIYFGISRYVIKRLNNHIKGKTHHQASLAYLITKEKYSHNGRRKKLELQYGKEKIKNMEFKFIEITCPIQ